MSSSDSKIGKPRLIIRPWVWDKMMFFARNKEALECSGLGLIEFDGHNFVVSETYMVPQVNTSTDTEMDADGVGKFLYQHKDKKGVAKWHWHSHVNMSAFWSGTDHELIKKNSAHGWFVHTVINLRGDKRTCVSQVGPFPFFMDDIETVIESPPYSDEQYAEWQNEYSENAKQKSHIVRHHWDGTRRVLPDIEPYRDSLNRHSDQKPVGDHGTTATPGDSASPAMSYSDVLNHLKGRLDRLNADEVAIEDKMRADPSNIETQQEWWRVNEQIEECNDLISRVEDHLQEQAEDVIAQSKANEANPKSDESRVTMGTGTTMEEYFGV